MPIIIDGGLLEWAVHREIFAEQRFETKTPFPALHRTRRRPVAVLAGVLCLSCDRLSTERVGNFGDTVFVMIQNEHAPVGTFGDQVLVWRENSKGKFFLFLILKTRDAVQFQFIVQLVQLLFGLLNFLMNEFQIALGGRILVV